MHSEPNFDSLDELFETASLSIHGVNRALSTYTTPTRDRTTLSVGTQGGGFPGYAWVANYNSNRAVWNANKVKEQTQRRGPVFYSHKTCAVDLRGALTEAKTRFLLVSEQ